MWRLAGSMLFNLVLASNSWGQSGPLQLIVAFPADLAMIRPSAVTSATVGSLTK